MKQFVRKCLLRRIACQNAARQAEMTLPAELAVQGAVLEIDSDRWQVAVVAQPPIKPAVKREVLEYLSRRAEMSS